MKKGFTLVELLGVIVILGLIAMIAIPTINSSLNSSRDKAYDEQVRTIEDTARTYMSKNSLKLPSQTEGSMCCLSVSTIQQAGLLTADDIKNPKYKKDSTEEEEKYENFNGTVIITFTNNKYKYEYANTTCTPVCE